MKKAFLSTAFLAAVLATSITACSDKKETSAPTARQKADLLNDAVSNNSSGGVLSAPGDYLGAVVKAKQSAVKTIDATAINSALQQFYVGEGRFPTELQELVTKKYMPELPAPPIGMKFEYDANAGTVKVVRQ